jgi:hypothetical protein
MPYDEYTADRIREVLDRKKVGHREIKMMGGLCMMVDEKMCCGLLTNKEDEQPMLMARIGEAAMVEALTAAHVHSKASNIRPMKGYVFVGADGIDREDDLESWINKCLAYNPLAKSSKKKKK